MQNKRTQISIIHVAKKQLGLDDTAYRAILSGAGLSSSKDIKTDAQFNTVMGAFQQLGFRSTSWIGRRPTVSGTPGMITKPQEYYIKGLWALAGRFKDEKSLRRIIKRIGKVDDISFLPRRSASAVILALRDICWKAGFNPDTKEAVYVNDGKKSGGASANGTPPGVLPAGDGGDRIGQNRQSLATGTGRGGGIC
jgi:hypothetical protein